jgi:hypothetical protein
LEFAHGAHNLLRLILNSKRKVKAFAKKLQQVTQALQDRALAFPIHRNKRERPRPCMAQNIVIALRHVLVHS